MTARQAKGGRLAPIAGFIGSIHASIDTLAPLVLPAPIGGLGCGIIPLGRCIVPRGTDMIAASDRSGGLPVELLGPQTIQPVRLVCHRLRASRSRQGGEQDREKNTAHHTR
jgi:hypothetical protein